eukprot:1136283-Pelagomonas_calceolata.AAC.1
MDIVFCCVQTSLATQLTDFRMEVTPKWHAGAAAQLNKAAGAPSSDAAHLQTPPVLVIEPMKPKWKDMTADLLTQLPANLPHNDAKSCTCMPACTSRTLLRRRISFYLDEQAKLLPKTVLLTATLHCSGSPTAHQHTQPEASQGPHPLPSSAHDSTEGASSTQQPPDLGRQQQQALSLDHVSQRRSIQQSSSRSYESTGQQQQHSSTQGLGVAEGDAQCPSRSHRGADTACANHVPRMPSPLLQPPHSTSNSERGNASPVSGAANCESSSSSSSGREHGLASSGVGVELLVGTAEVSFDRITHGRHLYLNPPNVSPDPGVWDARLANHPRCLGLFTFYSFIDARVPCPRATRRSERCSPSAPVCIWMSGMCASLHLNMVLAAYWHDIICNMLKSWLVRLFTNDTGRKSETLS